MSQNAATVRPLARPRPTRPEQPARARLTAVEHPAARRRAWFPATCLLMLVSGLLALLLLNTTMAESSFALQKLQGRSAVLADQQEALQEQIDSNRAPARLAQRAMALGMVPAQSTGYISLDAGKVVGVAEPAVKDGRFTVVTATDPKAAKAAADAAAAKRAAKKAAAKKVAAAKAAAKKAAATTGTSSTTGTGN